MKELVYIVRDLSKLLRFFHRLDSLLLNENWEQMANSLLRLIRSKLSTLLLPPVVKALRAYAQES